MENRWNPDKTPTMEKDGMNEGRNGMEWNGRVDGRRNGMEWKL